MRLAVLSDIHGNPIALEAVLRDVTEQGGADAYVALGDFAAIGYDPVTPIERVASLPNVACVRGNTDRYTASEAFPLPGLANVQAEPGRLPAYVETTASIAWTRGYLTAAGKLDWLARLPLEQRLTLPDGTRLLAVHAAPGADDGPGLPPNLTDEQLAAALAPAGADLIFVGHTHFPIDRSVNGQRVVNPGSISNPMTGDPRASYVLLDANQSGYHLERRQVAYDYGAAIAAVEQARHPAGAFIIRHLRNDVRSRW
jgi:predicted phosphodiesterase